MHGRFGAVPGVHWLGGITDVRPYLYAADVNVSPSLSENPGRPARPAPWAALHVASAVGELPVFDGWAAGWSRPTTSTP